MKSVLISLFTKIAPVWLVMGISLAAAKAQARQAKDLRGAEFLSLRLPSSFRRATNEFGDCRVWTSGEIRSRIPWNELVISWNADPARVAWLKLEARAIYPDRTTKWYELAQWSLQTNRFPRRSRRGQRDDDGDVLTDTLVVARPCQTVQLRATAISPDGRAIPRFKFLGLSFLNSRLKPPPLPYRLNGARPSSAAASSASSSVLKGSSATSPLSVSASEDGRTPPSGYPFPPRRSAWGKTLDVPEMSQLDYPGGEVWCSPTSLSMILGYWATKLRRPDLGRTVPEIASGVYDPNWPGTGNWPFNMAYAGAFPGLRAYVTRLTDLAEVEKWLANGVPVALSVCYNRLRGLSAEPSGHLVVCVGFTENGDPILNDPGTHKDLRKVFARERVIHAWEHSRNTVYLVHPEKWPIPVSRWGHW